MSGNKYHSFHQRLSEDIGLRFGKRIAVKQVSKLFWFNTESAFIRSVYLGHFPLPIYGKLSDRNSYILSTDLVNYLADQYAISENATIMNYEGGINMK